MSDTVVVMINAQGVPLYLQIMMAIMNFEIQDPSGTPKTAAQVAPPTVSPKHHWHPWPKLRVE